MEIKNTDALIEHLRESLVSAGETIEELRDKLYKEQNLAISWANLADSAAKDCTILTQYLLMEPTDWLPPRVTEAMARWISKAKEAWEILTSDESAEDW